MLAAFATGGSKPVTLNGVLSAPRSVISPKPGSATSSAGARIISGVTSTKSPTLPTTSRNASSSAGPEPRSTCSWKVTRLVSVTPCFGPALMEMSVSTVAPGAIGSSGQLGVVHEQSAIALVTVSGLVPRLVSFTFLVTGTPGMRSPMSSVVGSRAMAASEADFAGDDGGVVAGFAPCEDGFAGAAPPPSQPTIDAPNAIAQAVPRAR